MYRKKYRTYKVLVLSEISDTHWGFLCPVDKDKGDYCTG